MPRYEGSKLDLLRECNDQGIPPNEFKAMLCSHCRNAACVNAGWSSSKFEERVLTQVARLLTNPNFADPKDPRFEGVRALHFREIEEPLVVQSGDPWEPPPGAQVHFSDGERKQSSHEAVETAIAQLAPKNPKRAVEALGLRSDEPAPPSAPSPTPQPPPAPVAETRPEPLQVSRKPDPRHFQRKDPPAQVGNTAFPAEGMMLDGSSPAATPAGGSLKAEDPWAAPVNPAPRKVTVGATVKMGSPKK